MKLLNKYNRVNGIATVIVLLLSAACYYFFLRAVLIHQLDKDIKVEESEITDFIKENNALPEPTNYKDEQEEFIQTGKENIIRNFSSVDIFNKDHHENISYRQLEFPASVGGKEYKILVRKSQVETDDLIRLILLITLSIIFFLLVTLFFINRFFLSKLWKPFNSTLEQIKQFNLSGKEKISLSESDVSEFKELNQAVSVMTSRANQDYDEIKSFTENASHEIQTPLAIIKSKLELLSQSDNLKEDQMNTIQSIHEATNRLSKLNLSLILLTKIDNQQFRESESVDMSFLLHKNLTHFEELTAAKRITVTENIEEGILALMNETLAEILISNLITNAIKHNIEDGFIAITLNQHGLTLANSGIVLSADPLELFDRFKKDTVTSESLGLGLSIIKKIVDLYNFKIEYRYSDLVHTLHITF